jgi:aspartyl-tRNA(Asn)/glutamyl-tRNA(Gln) amidotransferase subunit C
MIDAKVIQHIARLAKLEVPEKEMNKYCDQLIKVLGQFEEIRQIDTTGVEPLVTPVEIEMTLRPDIAIKQENLEELLENAPEKTGNLLTVPPVV